jgi:hypothetical protein
MINAAQPILVEFNVTLSQQSGNKATVLFEEYRSLIPVLSRARYNRLEAECCVTKGLSAAVSIYEHPLLEIAFDVAP